MNEERTARSYAPIKGAHLQRLSAIAAEDRARFLRGYPEYRRRLLCVVLAQGAARHFIDGTTGVKDFDVWSFFAAIRGRRFPADRRETTADFGPSSFGRQRYDHRTASAWVRRRIPRWERFEGRRVDLLMRALRVSPRADPAEAIRSWLQDGIRRRRRRPPSSWYLGQKALVLIDPSDRRGEIVWPIESDEIR